MKDLTYLEKFRQKNDENRVYGAKGDCHNGIFKVYVSGRSFFVVVSNGGGWDHVSVSPCSRTRQTCPTWEEMCAIKDMFFEPEECVVEYHPAKSEYIDNYPYCLHLWRPQEVDIPTPPKIYV